MHVTVVQARFTLKKFMFGSKNLLLFFPLNKKKKKVFHLCFLCVDLLL